MKIWEDMIPMPQGDFPYGEFFTEETLFLDIETTGLSRSETNVYLIGCAARDGEKIRVTQFFAERPREEKQVLEAFLAFLTPYGRLATFNGKKFDVPYLQYRCQANGIRERLGSLPHLDLYEETSGLKHVLGLPNRKQKTWERFLGIAREDRYSGGELISVYREYAAHPTAGNCALLKIHNHDDMAGMPSLLPILAYRKLFDGCFRVLSFRLENGLASFRLGLSYPLPKPVSASADGISLTGRGSGATLSVGAFVGELKRFYPNYKDYYYLPDEDMAVHKSVAAYVDKDHRRKSAAADCYVRREGAFLPQFREIFTPAFRSSYKGEDCYFELTEDFLHSEERQKEYAAHVLTRLLHAR